MSARTPALPGFSDSHASPKKSSFFGLDMGLFRRDLMIAWQGMLSWKVISWIKPQQSIRIHLADGSLAISKNLKAARSADEKSAATERFEAILLPEHLLLRTNLQLPKLPPFEMDAALNLEIQSLSPFPKADVVWSHDVASKDNTDSVTRVQVVMSSRKLVAQHIESTHPTLKLQTLEVLAAKSSGDGYHLLPGFGEARRVRQGTIWTWINVSLVLVALALIAAMAVTPSVQLFFRFMQGYRAMIELQSKATPVMAQRESFVRTSEQLSSLSDIVGKSVPSLQTLTLITQALPDDTSLLNLQVKDSKVSISGQTGDAAALMKALDSTPGLRDVKAPSPATKPLGATRESFSIEFTLDPAQIKLAR